MLIPAAGAGRRLGGPAEAVPKCLLPVAGRALVEHSLKVLSERGFRRVVMVVGWRRESIIAHLGDRFAGLAIEYAVCADHAETEHGWSLYQARALWQRDPGPILLLDADSLYAPGLIDLLLDDPRPGVLLTDRRLPEGDREEELVLGAGGRVTGLVRAVPAASPGAVGVFVGINRFSADWAAGLFAYMEGFFAREGRRHKYERVFDAYRRETGAPLAYRDVGGRPWLNVNYEDDYAAAAHLAALMSAERRGDPHRVEGGR